MREREEGEGRGGRGRRGKGGRREEKNYWEEQIKTYVEALSKL